jgi:hypothetical protein
MKIRMKINRENSKIIGEGFSLPSWQTREKYQASVYPYFSDAWTSGARGGSELTWKSLSCLWPYALLFF